MTDNGGRVYAALGLARRGFRVFPLRVKGWTPALEGWKDWATTDEEVISRKWAEADYNIGVACGAGLLVVDVDEKPGKTGDTSLLELNLDLDDYDTFTVRTPSGGRHLYYEAPDYNNSAGRLGRDLDIRSAGGYVVGPGSVLDDGAKNAKGGVYVIEHDAGLVPAPVAVTGRLHRPEKVSTVAPAVDLDSPEAIARAVDWLQHAAPLAIEGQNGDAATFGVAARVKDFGVSEATALDLLSEHWNERCSPPWQHDDLKTKVENAYAYGKRPAGADHPAAIYEGVHIASPIQLARPWFNHGDDWRGSVNWLYYETLPTTGVCILTAPSGAGKTFVTLDLAHSLAVGRPWFGIDPEVRGASLLLIGEAYGSVKLRLAALAVAQGATDRPLPVAATYVGGLAARGAWEALGRDLMAKAAAMESEHGLPVRLIVLDTLSASGILDDENNNAEAATVMKMMAELSAAMNALFIVVHHPPKSGEGERGAGAIRNNADYVLMVKREGQAAVREISMDKSRDGEQKVLGTFTLVPVEIGKDDKGRAIKTMVLSTGEGRVYERKEGPGEKYSALFAECLGYAIDEYGTDIDGVVMVEEPEVLNEFTDRVKGSRDRSNINRKFRAALSYADDQGLLNRVTYSGRRYLAFKDFS